MSIKRIKVKNVEFVTSLSIVKGTIDIKYNMNSYCLEKREIKVLLLHFLTRNLICAHH